MKQRLTLPIISFTCLLITSFYFLKAEDSTQRNSEIVEALKKAQEQTARAIRAVREGQEQNVAEAIKKADQAQKTAFEKLFPASKQP